MRPLQSLSSLFFVLLVSSACKASTLEDTCKAVAADYSDISYDYCIKIFQADKGSATADARGLAAIAATLAKATATATGTRIAALKGSEKDAARRERLGVCAEVYSDAVDQLGEAAKDIKGKSDDAQGALAQLSAALDAPSTCEDTFGEANDPSPLSGEDAEFKRQATIALAIASSLSSSGK